MLRQKVQLFQRSMLLSDMLWVSLSWMGAYWLRFLSDWIPVYFGTPGFGTYLTHLPLVLVVWLVAFINSGVYRTDRWWSVPRELRSLFRGTMVAMVLLIFVTYFSTKAEISRIFYVCFGCLAVSTLSMNRIVLRPLIKRISRSAAAAKRVLLVGANAMVPVFRERVRRHPEMGLNVIGRVLPETPSCRSFEEGLPVLGSFSDLRRIVLEEKIDLVVFALTLDQSGQITNLLSAVQDLTADIHVIPDLFPIMPLRAGVEDFGGIPLIRLRASPQQGISKWEKRVLDLLVSGLALALLCPALALMALLVKCTSPGPVLYRQVRVGFDGKKFTMFKFRTMRVSAELGNRPVWSQRVDPRRTRLGAFLRRYSLDEIPQIWNVLKGDMSLVGPRPERPEFVQDFCKIVPSYMLRHKVKSGLTGLAQVRGWRGATSLEKRIECDIEYMEHWSMALDLKILWRTLWKGFINRAEG
ncbi:MAG: undecaprenyl-phosphate glucose phosphotransferase [bacterium]